MVAAGQKLRPLSAQRFFAPPSTDLKGKKRAVVIDVDESEEEDGDDEGAFMQFYAFQLVSAAHRRTALGGPVRASRSELCVHKRKVEDVRKWLKEALFEQAAFRFRRILVLSGPAGACKTTTIRLLAEELETDIQEYKSPEAGTESLAAHFTNFLARASAAPALSFGDAPSTGPSQPKRIKAESQRKTIVLVEDLPNLFTSPETAQAFGAALSAYASTTRSAALGVPLVVIVSEALARGDAGGEHASMAEGRPAWQSSVTARTVVPADVLNGGRATEIKFNPVAPTLLKKALNRIVDDAIPSDSPRPKDEVLDLVVQTASGDMRSALNNLQFVLRNSQCSKLDIYECKTAKAKGKKKAKAKAPKRPLDAAMIQLISARESSLFLFHAIGKVLYSKRWGEDADADDEDARKRPHRPPDLPVHLRQWSRTASKVNLEDLLADLPVDVNMFASYLHQNFPSFVDDVYQSDHALSALSDADCLPGRGDSRLRQHPLFDKYNFELAVRGIMMALPTPVPRRQQKVYKSQQWDNQRKARETAASLDVVRSAFSPTIGSGLSSNVFLVDYAPFLASCAQLHDVHRKLLSDYSRYKMPAATRIVLDEHEAGSEGLAPSQEEPRSTRQDDEGQETAVEDSDDPIEAD